MNLRRLHQDRGGGLQSGRFHFIDASWVRARRLVHLLAQIPGREIADELLGLLNERKRILASSDANITIGGSAETPLKNE